MMKKHKAINIVHCPDCYDKIVSRGKEASMNCSRVFVLSKKQVELYQSLAETKRAE